MVYEFVLKLFGKGAVDMISLLPFLITLNSDRFQTSVIVTKPYTSEIVRLVKTGHPVSFKCELSVIVNRKYRFVKTATSRLAYREGVWIVDGKSVGNSVPDQAKFSFTYAGFRFDSGDKLELFATVSITDDALFEKSTGFRTGVLWNYITPSKISLYRFENDRFINDDH